MSERQLELIQIGGQASPRGDLSVPRRRSNELPRESDNVFPHALEAPVLRVRSQQYENSASLSNAALNKIGEQDDIIDKHIKEAQENLFLEAEDDSFADNDDSEEDVPTENSHCNPVLDRHDERVAIGNKIAVRFNAASRYIM